ncbi:hypothetical protein JI721_12510 [Alicyclobacillus cycloheptanicus]|uniref:Hook-length control protein FliK n=1 Tax=Alicyclobacillus cycloheptanicus TaxID=1457 RepID=A0ABT9XG67_9BACL|nr:hypothetical protein [Alicyclobacillus cycloheptanicus]MDQ0188823.1 hypothetical protein [Alicyclobacillus cycloheptanicus]WDM00530.1 hypothetical protein JI721_12510 [Alicyclobacillus cycloheptanicus]
MWFWSRHARVQRETLQRLDELSVQLRDVLDKLPEHKIQVNVQSLHVDRASLERLVFQLDRLDIEELSGSLNLGNNFGTDAVRAKKHVMEGTKQESSREPPVSGREANTAESGDTLANGTRLEPTGQGFKVTLP